MATAPAAKDEDGEDHPSDPNLVNGLGLMAWYGDLSESCTLEQDGVTGTARADDKLPCDWIWVSVQGGQLPDVGAGCFVRVTDGQGRVLDSDLGQNVELTLVKDRKPRKEDPVRAAVFRLPAQWARSPEVSLELYSQGTLIAGWKVEGANHRASSTPSTRSLTLTSEAATMAVRPLAEYRTRPNGMVSFTNLIEFRLDDPQDRDLRWVVELDAGADEPTVVVGRGNGPVRLPLTKRVEPGEEIKLEGTLYLFETRAAVTVAEYCSLKRPEGGLPLMHCGAGIPVNLSWNAGKFRSPQIHATATELPNGDFEFEFPCKWTKGKESLVGGPLEVGQAVGALLKTSRGKLVATVKPQDTFKVRMSAQETSYLKGGRFTFDIWLESRKLLASTKFGQGVACVESDFWTRDAALTRSDEGLSFEEH